MLELPNFNHMIGVANTAGIIKIVTMFIKKIKIKTQKKLKEFEIMYQNGIYICISSNSKIC